MKCSKSKDSWLLFCWMSRLLISMMEEMKEVKNKFRSFDFNLREGELNDKGRW